MASQAPRSEKYSLKTGSYEAPCDSLQNARCLRSGPCRGYRWSRGYGLSGPPSYASRRPRRSAHKARTTEPTVWKRAPDPNSRREMIRLTPEEEPPLSATRSISVPCAKSSTGNAPSAVCLCNCRLLTTTNFSTSADAASRRNSVRLAFDRSDAEVHLSHAERCTQITSSGPESTREHYPHGFTALARSCVERSP